MQSSDSAQSYSMYDVRCTMYEYNCGMTRSLSILNITSYLFNNIMLIKRRQFLQIGSLATGSFMIPKFLKAFENKVPFVPGGNKVVVMMG